LLDWTENPLTALYFALMGAQGKQNNRGKTIFEEAATVWILDPVKWNQYSLRRVSFKGGALAPGDENLNGYIPSSSFSGILPLALYGVHNSPRIVAQQGVFTIFGKNTFPMEEICTRDNFPQDCLIRITIKSSVIGSMRKSLLNHGITESVVFPDLEGLALEIKRHFGFEA
jgi:hypothetical protein